MNLYASKSYQEKIKQEYQQIREVIISKLGGQCWKCGSRKALSLHHILPVRYYGDNRKMNLILLCLDRNAGQCHWKYNGKSYRWIKENKDKLIKWSKTKIIKEMRKVLVDGDLRFKPR